MSFACEFLHKLFNKKWSLLINEMQIQPQIIKKKISFVSFFCFLDLIFHHHIVCFLDFFAIFQKISILWLQYLYISSYVSGVPKNQIQLTLRHFYKPEEPKLKFHKI